jgi:hypothetical protein
MRAPAFSPAPWSFHVAKETEDGERLDGCAYVLDAEGHEVAQFWSADQTITYLSQATQEGNALLTSKAPELFVEGGALLQALDDWLLYYGPATDEVQAAMDRLRAVVSGAVKGGE